MDDSRADTTYTARPVMMYRILYGLIDIDHTVHNSLTVSEAIL